MNTIHIKVNRNAQAVHASHFNGDHSVHFPRCGAPGNTPAAFRAWRPVVVPITEPVTCKRCAKLT